MPQQIASGAAKNMKKAGTKPGAVASLAAKASAQQAGGSVMKSGNLRKLVFFGGLAVLAIAAILLATENGGSGTSTRTPGGADAVLPMANDGIADVESAIDLPADRATTVQAPESVKPGAAPGIAVAPSVPSRESAKGSGGVTTTEGDGGSSALLVDDRKIVQTASMRLEVKEVGASFEEVGRVATAAGGFVASSSLSNQGESQIASMTIRVPIDRYQDVLRELRGLGEKVVAEDSKSSDVTAEYTDLGSRLRNLEATELQLLNLLGRATTINEILQVQDRLNSVRAEIEQVKGRMALLDRLTELATIAVHLTPVPVASNGGGDGGRIGEEISQAWDESLEFLTDVAAGVLSVIVFAWWTPIVAIPALVIGSRLLRGRPQRLEAVD
jgi:hypothetical protein